MHSRSEGGKGQFGVEKSLLHREMFLFLFLVSCLFSHQSILSFSPSFLKGDKEGNVCLKQHMSVVAGVLCFLFCRREAAKNKTHPHKNARDAQYS
jgi:hypothetical protein